jgi:hypothetical protein
VDAAQSLLEERVVLRGNSVDGYASKRLELLAMAKQQAV